MEVSAGPDKTTPMLMSIASGLTLELSRESGKLFLKQ